MRTVLRCLLLAIALPAVMAQQGAGAAGNPKIDSLCGGDPALAVMSSDLLEARLDVLAGKSAATVLKARMPQAMRAGKIQAIVGVKEVNDKVLSAIKAQGLDVVHTFNDGTLHTVTVRGSNPRQFDAIAHLSETRVIRSEPAGQTLTGSVTSQGDGSHRASVARQALGIDGTGYCVGVLSDSIFDGRGGVQIPPATYPGLHVGSLDQVSGDLPPAVWVIDPGPGGGSDEGNAMAQIVYDLAPGCGIAYASASSGYFLFAGNILALANDATSPSQVIVDDYIYYSEPMYQNGPIAICANTVVTSGVPYFTAAANFSANGHERNYNDTGVFDGGPVGVGNDLHDFGLASGAGVDPYLTFSIGAPGGSVVASLHWDEPYGGGLAQGPGAGADLDLYLLSSPAPPGTGGNIMKQSVTMQGTIAAPAGDACEELVELTLPAGTYHLCINHANNATGGRNDLSVPPLKLSLIVKISGGPVGTQINDAAYLGDRTIYGHSAAENVQAIAALFYWEEQQNGNFIVPLMQLDVESFSSLGGALPFWFPDAGMPRNAVAQTRNKPDLTGIDGVDTTFFGSSDFEPNGWQNFYGTSAAAPHVAAIAALMLDRADNLGQSKTPAQIYSSMQTTARDCEAAGWDSLSGFGLVDANASVPVVFSAFVVE